jgi:hypothetical protein
VADSDDFVVVARVIERSTSLNEMQSRGLVRRLLKEAGLNADDATPDQLAAVGRSLLGEALKKNGVADVAPVVSQWLEVCARQAETLRTSGRLRVSNTVEEVFARMGLKR